MTTARPLELYLVRHAVAAERGDDWPDDTLRPLTTRGISRFRQAVSGLSEIGVTLDDILTSPLVRAKQTADLLASGLSASPPVRTLDALAPGHAPARVLARLGEHPHRRVALVGHEPGLGELAAHLLGAAHALPFKKGGVCRIDVERLAARGGTLVWFATPRLLRGAGRRGE